MSNWSAAQRNLYDDEDPSSTPPAALLKRQVQARLEAHRSRRGPIAEPRATAPLASPSLCTQRHSIAAAVAHRFAQTQSYMAFLAAEAEEAMRRAEASAALAARTAEALASAKASLLADRAAAPPTAASPHDRPPDSPGTEQPQASTAHPQSALAAPPSQKPSAPQVEIARDRLTIRLYEDIGLASKDLPLPPLASSGGNASGTYPFPDGSHDAAENHILDEEIAFRQSATVDLARPNVSIPGNLLEFPRQLVAARKARPRYAEGPLREDAEHAQLRIFEVEAVQSGPAPAETAAAEWSSIWLESAQADLPPETHQEKHPPSFLRPETAALATRLMAVAVDACIVAAAFIAFASAFAWNAPVLPSPTFLAVVSLAVMAILYLLYHLLCFSVADATPGMRYARIGLCTLSDDNPTRAQMRNRTFAVLLAALPLGFGLFWAALDEDGLGWHDRISRMYPRSY